jgi:hypothetical protein
LFFLFVFWETELNQKGVSVTGLTMVSMVNKD